MDIRHFLPRSTLNARYPRLKVVLGVSRHCFHRPLPLAFSLSVAFCCWQSFRPTSWAERNQFFLHKGPTSARTAARPYLRRQLAGGPHNQPYGASGILPVANSREGAPLAVSLP